MPEPNTVTAPPEGEHPRQGSTVGWSEPPGPAPASDAALPHTRTEVSTPGPAHPERQTHSDDTERLPGVAEPAHLPQIPGYLVQGVLGHGGMGVVYRAVHLELNKSIALKVIYPRGQDVLAVRERFTREVQALAGIEHPNVVPIYHAGDWHGFPYFTMKLVPDGPLSRHLGRFAGRYAEIARLVAKVARAVQALHHRGIIHRDLKPLNILMGEGDEPLVADFGLAKWLDDTHPDMSLTGAPVGTRHYMSPEQTQGRRGEYAPACDVWAIGITLYELLSGCRPFSDPDDAVLYEKIRTEEPAPLPASVPPELRAVVSNCLAKRPGERYPSAAAVADDLESWSAGGRVKDPPSHPRVRPNGRWVAAGLLALVAVITVPAVTIPRDWFTPVTPTATSVVPHKTIAQRLQAWEPVGLTDDKGRPLVPGYPISGFELPMVTDPKSREVVFTTNSVGMIDLVDEVLPLPVRLEADVTLVVGRPHLPMAGVYATKRYWDGGPVGHHSLVRFVLRPDEAQGAGVRTALGHTDAVWYRAAGELNSRRLSQESVPVNDPPGRRVTARVSVLIEHDRLTPSFNGVETEPTRADQLLKFLTENIVAKPDLQWYPFQPPAFGTGVGITVGHAEAVVRNLTLTRERGQP